MKELHTHRSERGQSLVELALSMTVLLILLAGAVDLGRAFFNYIAMRDAAQEGLVYASLYPDRCDRIKDRIDKTIDGTALSSLLVEYNTGSWQSCETATMSSVCAMTPIRVTLRRDDFPITMPFLGTFVGSQTISLKATVTGSALRPTCP